jgi:hypothetical protein
MKLFFVIFNIFCLFFASCGSEIKNIKPYAVTYPIADADSIAKIRMQFPLLKINLSPKIAIHWDNKTSTIVKDYLYYQVIKQFNIIAPELINAIVDTTTTQAIGCPENNILKIGDVAYVLLNDINLLPLSLGQELRIQTDVLVLPCVHFSGTFFLLSENRQLIKMKYLELLKKK